MHEDHLKFSRQSERNFHQRGGSPHFTHFTSFPHEDGHVMDLCACQRAVFKGILSAGCVCQDGRGEL